MTPEELLKEVGEPVAYSIFICGEPCDVYLNKDDAESEYTRRNERYPDKTRSLQYLFTSDQVAAAILKATKPLEDQLSAAQEENGRLENQVLARDAELWGRTQEILGLKDQLTKAEQRVAEACALTYLEDYDLTDIAERVRAGEWRKFVKEV